MSFPCDLEVCVYQDLGERYISTFTTRNVIVMFGGGDMTFLNANSVVNIDKAQFTRAIFP